MERDGETVALEDDVLHQHELQLDVAGIGEAHADRIDRRAQVGNTASRGLSPVIAAVGDRDNRRHVLAAEAAADITERIAEPRGVLLGRSDRRKGLVAGEVNVQRRCFGVLAECKEPEFKSLRQFAQYPRVVPAKGRFDQVQPRRRVDLLAFLRREGSLAEAEPACGLPHVVRIGPRLGDAHRCGAVEQDGKYAV